MAINKVGEGLIGLADRGATTAMKSILDRSFRYTPSVATNLKKTFARIRRDQARDALDSAEIETNVSLILRPVRK